MPPVVPIRPLTPRQLEVARCLARGLSYAAIAVELGVSRRTVEAHVQQIALVLPNPHGLAPSRLVMVWAAEHQQEHAA